MCMRDFGDFLSWTPEFRNLQDMNSINYSSLSQWNRQISKLNYLLNTRDKSRWHEAIIRRPGHLFTKQGIASVLLLLNYGADVNAMADARHDYRTVLHYAILGGDPAVINLLLKQGASLDLGPDYQKPTALDLAILKGEPAIVAMLLESGTIAV